jgi:hypothetical protein
MRDNAVLRRRTARWENRGGRVSSEVEMLIVVSLSQRQIAPAANDFSGLRRAQKLVEF